MQAWGNDPRRWSHGSGGERCSQRDSRAFMARPPAEPAHVVGRASTPARAARLPAAAAGQSAAADADVPAAGRVLLPGRRPVSSRAGRRRTHEAAVSAPHVAGRRHRLRRRQRGLLRRRAPDRASRRTELPACSAIRRWPRRCRLGPPATPSSRMVVLACRSLGPEGMELALVPFQRLARLLSEVDAESWAYEPGTFEALLAVAGALRVRRPAVGRHPRRIHGLRRLLVCAGRGARAHGAHRPAGVERPDEGLGRVRPPFIGHALSHDIFESATHAARSRTPSAWAGARRCSKC